MTTQQSNFIHKYEDAVIDATEGTGIFPSVKMAQLILETGWGKSTKGEYNNLFGIKAQGHKTEYWNGESSNQATRESGVGETRDNFRIYKSESDSIRDHTAFLMEEPRYKRYGVFEAPTPEEQAARLQSAGYATDPNYAKTLKQLIFLYNLTRLDSKKKL